MSDEVSDRSLIASSLTGESAPGLADLSEKDKPWDKHKANADVISNYYATAREYRCYSQRIHFCADLLEFKLNPDRFEGAYKLKLASARFCRVRTCTVCQWRRSLMWKARAYKILPKVVESYPTSRWLFVTLTVKNCKIDELRKTLDWMNKGFKRLTELKAWPAKGWIKSVEVTRGKDYSAHPHFHCLLMVPPSYFKGSNYLSQQRWCDLWQQCLRIDYQPVLDVKAIKPHNSPVVLIPEVIKYQTKESDLVADREWFLEYTAQIKKTRAIAVGGILKDYLKALEEEPEDLIGESEEDEVDEGSLYFGWKRKEKRYRMVEG